MPALNVNWRKSCLSVVMCVAAQLPEHSQYASKADSLQQLLNTPKEDTNRVKLLWQLSFEFERTNDIKSLLYLKQAEELARKLDWKKGVAYVLIRECFFYSKNGDFVKSVELSFEAIKLAEKINDVVLVSEACARTAENYRMQGNEALTKLYAHRALEIARKTGDENLVLSLLITLANTCIEHNEWDEFEKYYKEAMPLAISQKMDRVRGALLIGLGDREYYYKNYRQAVNHYSEALPVYVAANSMTHVAYVQSLLGKGYAALNRKDSALYFANAALELSEKRNFPKEKMDAYGALYHVSKTFNDYENALHYYLIFDSLQSLLYSTEKAENSERTRLEYEEEKKDALAKAEQEKKDLRNRIVRNSITAGFTGVLIFLVVVYRQRNKIAKEKRRSEELLLNILPAETADELKKTGVAKAKDFEEVTVLFTDFKNFTILSERLTAQELVNEINYCYSAFDKIISRHGIEKIKTIGDSYMCAGGLPVVNRTNATDIVKAALEIRDFMLAEKQARDAAGKPFFEIRIGCHTGSVVAGIVGIKKYSYDIWGDTVNIASRMESGGEAGKVNISGSTYTLVKDQFRCIHRGKIAAKNKGMIDMYFVEGMV